MTWNDSTNAAVTRKLAFAERRTAGLTEKTDAAAASTRSPVMRRRAKSARIRAKKKQAHRVAAAHSSTRTGRTFRTLDDNTTTPLLIA